MNNNIDRTSVYFVALIILLLNSHPQTICAEVSPDTSVLGPKCRRTLRHQYRSVSGHFSTGTKMSLDTSALVPIWFDTEVSGCRSVPYLTKHTLHLATYTYCSSRNSAIHHKTDVAVTSQELHLLKCIKVYEFNDTLLIL